VRIIICSREEEQQQCGAKKDYGEDASQRHAPLQHHIDGPIESNTVELETRALEGLILLSRSRVPYTIPTRSSSTFKKSHATHITPLLYDRHLDQCQQNTIWCFGCPYELVLREAVCKKFIHFKRVKPN
jgi:hypothetical protein